MWFLIFASLLTLSSGDSESDICDQNVHALCSFERPSVLISANEEVFDAWCPLLKESTKCISDYEVTCDSEISQPNTNYKDIMDLLDEVCDKSKKLHYEVLEALPCIRFALGNVTKTCSHPREPLMQLYEEYLDSESEAEELSAEEMGKYSCLNFIYEVSCLAEYTKKECGGHARDGVLELVHRSGFIYHRCSPDHVTDILDALSVLDVEESHKDALLITLFKFYKE